MFAARTVTPSFETLLRGLGVLLCVALVSSACGDDAADDSLGIVEVAPGQAIQIRSLNTITGDVAFFGLPIERSVRMAIEDYGTDPRLRCRSRNRPR